MLEQIHEILFEKKILDKNETIQNFSLLSDKYNVNTNYLETNKKKYILKTQNKINNQLPTLKNIYHDLRMFPLFSLRIYYCDQNMCLMEYIENDKYEITTLGLYSQYSVFSLNRVLKFIILCRIYLNNINYSL